jgi:hypothetical protein
MYFKDPVYMLTSSIIHVHMSHICKPNGGKPMPWQKQSISGIKIYHERIPYSRSWI